MKKDEFKKERTEKLVTKIKVIIDSTKSDSEKSREIMELLRKEYIYVRNSYINKFRAPGVEVTINPESEDVKLELESGDKEGTEDNEFTKIYAYSFGPFNSDEYFKIDKKYRIVWLFKEPYITNTWYEGDRGGHDQAEEYNTWDKIEYPTHRNAIEYTQNLLSELQQEEKTESAFAQEDLTDLNIVMSHICIIEVNHFPGLALKGTQSDDNIIRTWGEINADLLGKLLEFYKPDIICGGKVLCHFTFDSGTNELVKDRNYDKINDIAELTIKFGSLSLPVVERNVEQGKNYIYRVNGDRPVYLIDADHPSFRYFNPAVALEDVKPIIKWMKPNDKGL